ncbi:MAG: tetratricopeptide repeat protein [Planctomycetota bacterium]
MNEKKSKIIIVALLLSGFIRPAWSKSAQVSLRQGNNLYAQGNFNEAINKYNQALIEKPQAPEPKFNKANSYYRLDDLGKSLDLYREVAADSKDMKLVTKAKYNLGNCYFQQGSKQKDSDLQKALEDLQTSISYWRQVLDIEPENEKAARNIEVARLIIKDIIDQLNKQKQQQKDSRQDPNQPQQQQQDKQEQPKPQSADPNQQEQQQQQAGSQQDPNEQQEQQSRQQKEQPEQQQTTTPDTTAQEILDKEQRQRKMRQMLQRPRWQKVEKDW